MTKSKHTKQSRLISMLRKGARLSQLAKTLKWQPHTVRAALTKLRKDGWAIHRTVENGQSVYKIDVAQQSASLEAS